MQVMLIYKLHLFIFIVLLRRFMEEGTQMFSYGQWHYVYMYMYIFYFVVECNILNVHILQC